MKYLWERLGIINPTAFSPGLQYFYFLNTFLIFIFIRLEKMTADSYKTSCKLIT